MGNQVERVLHLDYTCMNTLTIRNENLNQCEQTYMMKHMGQEHVSISLKD